MQTQKHCIVITYMHHIHKLSNDVKVHFSISTSKIYYFMNRKLHDTRQYLNKCMAVTKNVANVSIKHNFTCSLYTSSTWIKWSIDLQQNHSKNEFQSIYRSRWKTQFKEFCTFLFSAGHRMHTYWRSDKSIYWKKLQSMSLIDPSCHQTLMFRTSLVNMCTGASFD